MKEDFYLLLGVSPDISQQDLKRVYRKLTRELHPDVNPSEEAEKRFKLITEAYETLGNREKRQEYDRQLLSQEAGDEKNSTNNGFRFSKTSSSIHINPPNAADFRASKWVFHASVPPSQMAEAWGAITEAIIKNNVDFLLAQAALPDEVAKRADPKHRNAGKMITFQTSDNPEDVRKTKLFLQDVERIFHAKGILAGPHVKTDTVVTGSAYMSYRGDVTPAEAYGLIDSFNVAAGNRAPRLGVPGAKDDPYKDYSMEASRVPLRRAAAWKWQEAETVTGASMMRVQVKDERAARAVRDTLTNAGLTGAEMVKSANLGWTVRISGKAMQDVKHEQARLHEEGKRPIHPGSAQRSQRSPGH